MLRFHRIFVPLVLAVGLVTSVPTATFAALGTATLYWTAPGGDSLTGRATAYDLRYSPTPITAANFAFATRVEDVPAPKTAGSAERFQVSGLVLGNGYYFSIKSVDQAGNWSGLSNVVFYVIRTTSVALPAGDFVSPPWPNPARASTRWSFARAAAGAVEIVVFDIAGRQVRRLVHGVHEAGPGEVTWDLRDEAGHAVVPGVYLVRASLGARTWTQRIAIVR